MSGYPVGCLVVVLGPSGAGKDSILAASQEKLSNASDVRIVRRVITRPNNTCLENHVALDETAFLAQQGAGAFCVTWQAHNLYYGVPVCVSDWVNNGNTVILNGSRGALPTIQQAFPTLRVVHIVVDDVIRAKRLGERARESEVEIEKRLSRKIPVTAREKLDLVIHNNGELSQAVETFVAFIHSIRRGNSFYAPSALLG